MPDTLPDVPPTPSTPLTPHGHKKHKRPYDELERENHKLREDLTGLAQSFTHYYASTDSVLPELATASLPETGNSARHCVRMLEDHHHLDTNQNLNTAGYINVYLEKEEFEVANIGLQINLADQTVYPESFRVHNIVLNMVARLWNCPTPPDFNDSSVYPGACTVGSTEACLLGGLCLRFRWREWYAKRHNLTPLQIKGVVPNLVISSLYQAAWEKFFRYFDVEARFVQPSIHTFLIDPEAVKAQIDEKTIGVVPILGNHYGGQYDPVADIDAMLQALNKEKDWQVGMHIDAASGGFLAPFQPEVPVWDFRLPTVLSISASGHKFGESCCGTGWIVWRQREGLSEHVAISVSYLGGKADSYTLNFSRPATGVFVQYYKFHRLGQAGFRQLCVNRMSNAKVLRDALKAMTYNGKPRFTMLDSGDSGCLPVVTCCLNQDLKLTFDSIDLQHQMQQYHWYISGYRMCFTDPNTETRQPLFKDASPDMTMFRVVVKSNVTRPMIDNLISAFTNALKTMDELQAHYQVQHALKKAPRHRQHHGGHAC